jgi:dipeptidyl aminopeptidase/acylaminoacyl peptidase
MRTRASVAFLSLLLSCRSSPPPKEPEAAAKPQEAPLPTPAQAAAQEPKPAPAEAAAGSAPRVSDGARILENIPQIPRELSERLRRYLESRRADVIGWDASGKGLYIRTRFGSTAQLHHVSTPMGARKQLTFFAEPVAEAAPSPDPARPGIMFTMDRGGDEYTQIYWYDSKSREIALLSDGKSRNTSLLFSDDGKKLAYASTRRNEKDFDLWMLDPSKPTEPHRMIHEAQGLWAPLDWSPKGDRLLVMRYVSETKSELFVIEPGKGVVHQVSPVKSPELEVAMGGGVFSADGESVFYISDAGGELRALRHHDLKTGQDVVLSSDVHWDFDSPVANKSRTLLAVEVNEGGFSRLRILDLKTKRFRPDPKIPKGLIGASRFSPDGRSIAFTFESGKSPGDTFVLELASDKLTRWTESEVGGLDPTKFHEPTLVQYRTFDSVVGPDGKTAARMIPAFLTVPDGPGPHPVLVNIHGGPEAQWRPWFAPFFEFLVSELGIAVISPNVRGSTGYGRAYTLLDNGDKRESSVKDIGALLDWIATQPNLDKKRVAVFGGSYGGYMVLASGAHFADRIAAIVDVVGISNFVTFLESTKEYRRDLRRVEYGDERDPKMREFLEKISPTNNAEKITAPLFVAQGANDPRVPQAEAEQIVRKVRGQGRDVWYLLASDEGHGFQKKENRDFFSAATVMFLERHLLKPGQVSSK